MVKIIPSRTLEMDREAGSLGAFCSAMNGMPARSSARTRVLSVQEPMSQAHSGTESCIGSSTSPSIESGRFERTVTEAMTVERVADRFYEIHSQSGSTYDIDLQTGACTCPDCQQRGDQYVCKHTIRASLVEIVAEGVTTRTVAKVAGYARDPEHECPTGGHGGDCAGPPRRQRRASLSDLL